MKRAVVVLAGGAGTRLRPLSSEENPKQFLPLFDGESLLRRTFARVSKLVANDALYCSTVQRYAPRCRQHWPQLSLANILAEPARRNNAAAIALSTFTLGARLGENAAIAFLPSDHYIGDEAEFLRVLGRAFAYAESHDELMTIGIEAKEPNTEYGYLELGERLEDEVLRVRRFVEKPDLACAREFVRAGNYAWNAGMFIWRPSVFRRELERAAPELACVNVANYEQMPSLSIDYALMEKASHVATIRGDFGWSDVGSFEALRRIGVDVESSSEFLGVPRSSSE